MYSAAKYSNPKFEKLTLSEKMLVGKNRKPVLQTGVVESTRRGHLSGRATRPHTSVTEEVDR